MLDLSKLIICTKDCIYNSFKVNNRRLKYVSGAWQWLDVCPANKLIYAKHAVQADNLWSIPRSQTTRQNANCCIGPCLAMTFPAIETCPGMILQQTPQSPRETLLL